MYKLPHIENRRGKGGEIQCLKCLFPPAKESGEDMEKEEEEEKEEGASGIAVQEREREQGAFLTFGVVLHLLTASLPPIRGRSGALGIGIGAEGRGISYRRTTTSLRRAKCFQKTNIKATEPFPFLVNATYVA